jgi:uncharacterized SAM-binding protein YcdF (DUF218 family)
MGPANVGRIALQAAAALVIIVVIDVAVSGFILFSNANVDSLQHADAIVVLAGEHDGREDYGLDLARQGWARTVVLSNPYSVDDTVMERVCTPRTDIEVICIRPTMLTTRGEASAVRGLANQRSWHKIIVVSWRYHLPRARMIFRQCFSNHPGATVMRAVPRQYQYSLPQWEWVYIYQFAGYAKALFQGDCA